MVVVVVVVVRQRRLRDLSTGFGGSCDIPFRRRPGFLWNSLGDELNANRTMRE